jgi:hypothetical protein
MWVRSVFSSQFKKLEQTVSVPYNSRKWRQLVITLLLPNGIRNLEVHPNIDKKKLIIRGSAPKIFSDVNHMVDVNMVHNPFQIKTMEDALMTVHRPKSRSVRIYEEVDLLKQMDPLKSEDYVARIDPFSHATVMIVHLKCIKSKAHNLKKGAISFNMNQV